MSSSNMDGSGRNINIDASRLPSWLAGWIHELIIVGNCFPKVNICINHQYARSPACRSCCWSSFRPEFSPSYSPNAPIDFARVIDPEEDVRRGCLVEVGLSDHDDDYWRQQQQQQMLMTRQCGRASLIIAQLKSLALQSAMLSSQN